jgi:putative transposase
LQISTYIKVAGKDRYLYRAVDKEGNTVDFLLTKRRQKMSAQKFFNKAIGNNGRPRVVNTDKSGTNKMAIWTINKRSASINKDKTMQVFQQYS